MKRVLFLTALFMGTGTVIAQDKSQTVTIVFNLNFPLADSFKEVIYASEIDYQNAYGIRNDTLYISSETEFPSGATNSIALAWGYHNNIILNEVVINDGKTTTAEFRHIFVHERSHSQHPKYRNTVLYRYHYYTSVIGYSGLTLIINGPTENHYLSAFEEGVAEALYFKKYGVDTLTNNQYRAVGLFVLEMIERNWITVHDLSNGLQTNDLPCVVEKILFRQIPGVTQSDILEFVNTCEKVFMSCNVERGLREIEKIRDRVEIEKTALK